MARRDGSPRRALRADQFLPGNPVRSACDANGSGAAARAAQASRLEPWAFPSRSPDGSTRSTARRPSSAPTRKRSWPSGAPAGEARRRHRRTNAPYHESLGGRSASDPPGGRGDRACPQRPDKANALDAGLVEALLVAVARAANSGARLLTLRGEGRHFCAGFDFSDLDQQSDGDLLHRFVRIEQLLHALHHPPLPTPPPSPATPF